MSERIEQLASRIDVHLAGRVQRVPSTTGELTLEVGAGDLLDVARKLHDELLELNKAVFFDTNPIPIKYMAKRLGLIAENEHRLPMMAASPETEARCDAVLRDAGLLQS